MEFNEQKKIVVATNNTHKLQEIRSILGSSWRVLGAEDVAPGITWDETGETFLENARIKINTLRPHVSGTILADDSGLCVDALNGQPGVHSSRFGGVEGDHARNVTRLLDAMSSVSGTDRTAHFYCLLLLADETGRETRFEGLCGGRIALKASGEGGFGYDPVFIPTGLSKTMAELSEKEKNAISHRGQAMAYFKKYFNALR